jgi:hypothetical protein|tara:strand:+ start:321 stop:683 length:363 start_codon:yes stop_codon:yes gene_type:complete
MNHSQTIVSDRISTIVDQHKDISDCLLAGEKVAMIEEASYTYNELHSLITPDYLTDDEIALLTSIGKEWTEEVEAYNRAMQKDEGLTDAHRANMESIEEDIRKALEDLFNGGDGSGGLGV